MVVVVEDEEERLLAASELLLRVHLVLVEQLGVETDVAGLVHAVHVSERGGDGEVGADLGKASVDVPDVLGLGVEARVDDAGVVDTILLATSDTDLHLEPEAERGHALEVLDTGLDVLLLGLL